MNIKIDVLHPVCTSWIGASKGVELFATLQHWCWHIIMLSCHSANQCFSFYWYEQQISDVPREIIEVYEGPVWPLNWISLPCSLAWSGIDAQQMENEWHPGGTKLLKGMFSRIGKTNVCSIFRCVTLMTFSTKKYRLMILFFQIPAYAMIRGSFCMCVSSVQHGFSFVQ